MPWDDRDVPHGTVHIMRYQSKAQGGKQLYIYTPPGYEQDQVPAYPTKVENGRLYVDLASATKRKKQKRITYRKEG
jgi:hypothetical protein